MPIALGVAVRPWHDAVFLRHLCVLADEVGTDTERKIATVACAVAVFRD